MEHPDPKNHLNVSLAKSGIRILGCVGAIMLSNTPPLAIIVLSVSLAVAEVLGVIEELV